MTDSGDEQAIRSLTDRYSDAVNRRDWDALARCWEPDGVCELGPPINVHKVGVAAIIAEVRPTVEGMAFFVQMPHAGVVEVSGDRATARWTVNEIGRAADGRSGMVILASYADDLVRRDGTWRFARRAYRVVVMDTAPPPGKTY